MYVDVALAELWRTAFGSYDALTEDVTGMVAGEASAPFRTPGHFDDELDMGFGIESLGRMSMVVRDHWPSDGECSSKAVSCTCSWTPRR